MRYKQKRKYVWSNKIAYSVGLMASDGCLQSDGRHLDLTSIDIEQLKNYSRAIGRELRITNKGNKGPNNAYRIQFSDVAYYDFLINIGLTPKKSQTINKLNVPDKFYPHFLRGLFDGDGTTYAYHDPRWNNSYLYYISFTSASKTFLEYIADNNQRLAGVSGRSIRVGKKSYILGYCKQDSYLIYKFMYKDRLCIYLSRKRDKIEGFINKDKNVSI